MDDYDEYTGEDSSQELFSTDHDESEEENDREQERVLTYAEYRMLENKPKHAVLQTSDSSDDDEDQRKKQLPLKHRVGTRAEARLSLAPTVNVKKSSSSSSPPQTKRVKLALGKENRRQGPKHTTRITEKRCTSESQSNDATVERQTLKELEKTNTLIVKLIGRMKKTEERVRGLEDKLVSSASSSGSSSSSSTPKRPRAQSRSKSVPPEVRSETRRVYAMLCDESEEFEGWKIGPGYTYKDPENRAVLDCLIKEVKALNPDYISEHIKDAAYRFYRTRCEEASIARRGKASQKLKAKRRHERLTRKFQERKAALEKMSFKAPEQLENWRRVLKFEFMSSEESATDEDDEVIVIRSLPWRSVHVDRLFERLDHKAREQKSPQARRQMKRRVTGDPSNRPRPIGDSPTWAVNDGQP